MKNMTVMNGSRRFIESGTKMTRSKDQDLKEYTDAGIVHLFRECLQDEADAKAERQRVEAEVIERLIAKEEAGEKGRIQLASGEDVSLGEEYQHFTYEDDQIEKVHEWLKSEGLGNLIKEPKVHWASLNANLKQLVKDGVEIPDFMGIESRRTLTKRNM